MTEMGTPPFWRPLYDLAWAKLLVWIATASRPGELRPGVHGYLAKLYFELADAFRARGRVSAGKRMMALAQEHELAGPPREPPLLVMAMGIPQPPIITEARGQLATTPTWKERPGSSVPAGGAS